MNATVKVFFLVPYPLRNAPSQRFRVELFLPGLEKAGIKYKLQPFIDEKTLKVLYKKEYFFLKVWGTIKGFIKRFGFAFFIAPSYDYIFIHREASPIGPPFFEWWLAKVLQKKIIYDFDDAIWIPNSTSSNRFIIWLKAFWKVKYICKWASKVVGGNDYLCRYAKQFNSNVIRIPTCVDIASEHNHIKRNNGKLFAGWTGSHSTLKYLDLLVPVIRDLQKKMDFSFLVIADKKPHLNLDDWQFIYWNFETEKEDLAKMDVGLMPLSADAWSEGKCGFKLIQYFSIGIPAIASPVGVNNEIIENGRNGFLCDSTEEWKKALSQLLSDSFLREQMGLAGRKKIEACYSIQSQAQIFLQLFS